MDFCSECVYAKFVELEEGIKIYCKLKNGRIKRSNLNAPMGSIIQRKLNAPACADFKRDVSENR